MVKLLYWSAGLLLYGLSIGFSHADSKDINTSLFSSGDLLKIIVYGNPDLTLETKVNESGKITFPLLGEITIDGLTPNAAEKKIADMLQNQGFLRKPQVTILTTTLYSQQISVLGHVHNQGRYAIEGQRSLTDVLAMAGGISSDGGNTVTLIRTEDNHFVKEEIDVLAIFQSGDMRLNPTIRGGDLIYVPIAPRFYIYGEVQRPGFYRLEPNMTVVQALSTGGGLNQRGTERGVRIQRRDAEGALQVIKVKPDDLVRPDDVVYIQESLF
ncbi:polysaccharide export outer membrane protein [Nitrosomonas sp. Nm51]|uniref:polysaccharide export protein EpsE n=1 Tax=Nitrosomonas sp. Nm51 TaxID=133720 RepID=UPI0008D40A75|nr:polysaccharide export protein EpsE [Nitrosomonas sp. Nm51]SER64877.1 polysaccharide export outer membrane protein [Nitrosomonas sp. Nm51]